MRPARGFQIARRAAWLLIAVVLAGLVILWVRSYHGEEYFLVERYAAQPTSARRYCLYLGSQRGGLCVTWQIASNSRPAAVARWGALPPWNLVLRRDPRYTYYPNHDADPDRYTWTWRNLGFYAGDVRYGKEGVFSNYSACLIAPHWMPVSGLSLLLLVKCGALVRRYRRLRAGPVCAECGYDPRGTPDYCPECGTRRTVSPDRVRSDPLNGSGFGAGRSVLSPMSSAGNLP